MHDADHSDHRHDTGADHDHPVAIECTIDKYLNFVNLMATDDDFRARLEKDPLPTLQEVGVLLNLESDREPELLAVIRQGLPPKNLVLEHAKDLNQHITRDTRISMRANLAARLAEDPDLRGRLEKDPKRALSELGIDPAEVDIPEHVTLPDADAIREALPPADEGPAPARMTALRYHFNLEWHLLTTGGRYYD